MKLIIAIALGILVSPPAFASDQLPPYILGCLKNGASQRSARHGGVETIDVLSKYIAENETFYYANVKTPTEMEWGIVVRDNGSQCRFVGDDYVGDAGLYEGIDHHIVKEWTIQNMRPRIKEVGKSKLKAQLRDPFWQWHPAKIEAFKELGIW